MCGLRRGDGGSLIGSGAERKCEQLLLYSIPERLVIGTSRPVVHGHQPAFIFVFRKCDIFYEIDATYASWRNFYSIAPPSPVGVHVVDQLKSCRTKM